MKIAITASVLGAVLSFGWIAEAPREKRAPDRPASHAQLRPWLGEWKGSGWSMSATGERIEFDLAESVVEKAGGTLLLVEGHGVRTDAGGKGGTTHDGLVLVYRDAAGRWRWNGHEATSGHVDADVTLRDDGFQWSIRPDPKGPIVRFTIELDETEWREHGEIGDGGGTWTRFMEMKLHRVPR
jgi:hypothetical protein